MANIPFLTHPSFANVDRYEHSLGVAHLAWWWARKKRLSRDLGIALTIAALYHDGATPGHGHLFEEFLRRYGFDHEQALVRILEGNPEGLPGQESAQIFLGQQCKLRSVLPRPSDPLSVLTPRGIADLAAGNGLLGRLIKGDIDFDNIDNVIRACSAMGLLGRDHPIHPYDVVEAFEFEEGQLRLNRSHVFAVESWAEIRHTLYDSILNNSHEFRAQSAVKWAIEECAKEDKDLTDPAAWRLTDPMLTFEHLRKNAFARNLVDRVRIGNPPGLLFSAWIEDLSLLLGENSGEIFAALNRELGNLANMEVYVNYYVDKRERPIHIEPSKNRHLLEDEAITDSLSESTEPVRRQPSGVLGAIALSRIDRFVCESDAHDSTSLAKQVITEEQVSEVLKRILGQEPPCSSLGWVGTQSRPRQFSLFQSH
jgi:hypothetical protein